MEAGALIARRVGKARGWESETKEVNVLMISGLLRVQGSPKQ